MPDHLTAVLNWGYADMLLRGDGTAKYLRAPVAEQTAKESAVPLHRTDRPAELLRKT